MGRGVRRDDIELPALSRAAARRRGGGCRHSGRRARRWHTLGVRGLRFNHYFRDGKLHYRGGVPLDAATLARARDERARLAHAALDRREGLSRHDPDLAGDRPARRDRPHGPHRCAARHAGARLPGPVAPARRGRLLGEVVRCASREPRSAGLSGCARLSRGAGRRESRSNSCGARTGRIRAWKARCRTPATCSTCSTRGRRTRRSAARILVDNPARLYGFPP